MVNDSQYSWKQLQVKPNGFQNKTRSPPNLPTTYTVLYTAESSGNQQLMQIPGTSLRQAEQKLGIYIFNKREYLKIPVGIGQPTKI